VTDPGTITQRFHRQPGGRAGGAGMWLTDHAAGVALNRVNLNRSRYMTDYSPPSLPCLYPGRHRPKHVTHNEALRCWMLISTGCAVLYQHIPPSTARGGPVFLGGRGQADYGPGHDTEIAVLWMVLAVIALCPLVWRLLVRA